MNQSQIVTLRLLYASDGSLDTFTLFRRLRLPVSEYSLVLDSLVNGGYVEVLENSIRTLDKGRDFIAQSVFSESTKYKAWREVPDEYLGPQINPGTFYTPSIRLLDKKAFPFAKQWTK